jgi:topoisomerase IA-like protein
MARYGATASEKVRRAMHEEKRGELKSGRSGKTVTSRRQAIAIGLSEARRAGGKVPAKTSSAARKTVRKTTARKTTARKSTRKTATRRASA